MLDNGVENQEAQLVAGLTASLHADLGLAVQARPWADLDKIPIYLRTAYAFYRIQVAEQPYMGLVDKTRGQWSAATVAKQLRQVEVLPDLPGGPPLFISGACDYHQRRQLIAHHINFVVPGNQIYLPSLGMVLRERLQPAPQPVTKLGPAAALVVLKALTGTERRFSPSALAPALGYTAMTLTRAFNELESTRLAHCHEVGRQRILEFGAEGRELWDQAKPVLGSPVKQREWVLRGELPRGPVAGLHALADLTQLSSPAGSTLAVGRKESRDWRARRVLETTSTELPGAPELQVWWYPPELFARDGRVDPWSLYLSLRSDGDERVEMALNELEASLW